MCQPPYKSSESIALECNATPPMQVYRALLITQLHGDLRVTGAAKIF